MSAFVLFAYSGLFCAAVYRTNNELMNKSEQIAKRNSDAVPEECPRPREQIDDEI